MVGSGAASLVSFEWQHLDVGDVHVYHEVAGAGEPLILVHGLSGSGRWWARNAHDLAARHQVHVVDLAGFGRSRGSRRFTLGTCSDVIRRLMDQLGLDRASLVGHSMGGCIVADLAAMAPDRVDKLVLVSAAVPPLRRHDIGQPRDVVRTIASVPPDFWPLLVADAWRAGPVTLMGAARQLLVSDMRSKLHRILAPSLVIWGDRDRLLPLELGEDLTATLQDATLKVLRGAGHNPMWDRAEEFNSAVLEFLDSVPALACTA